MICFGYNPGEIYVANPSTQELVKLPKRRCSHHVCLGYIASRNEYKVVNFYGSWVSISLFNRRRSPGCEIFTLRDREGVSSSSWRDIGLIPGTPRTFFDYIEFAAIQEFSYQSMDGSVYWMITMNEDGYYRIRFACLDLEDEKYREFDLPQDCDSDKDSEFQIVKLKGGLCLARISLPLRNLNRFRAVDGWKVEDERNGIWVKQFSLVTPTGEDRLLASVFASVRSWDNAVVTKDTLRHGYVTETKEIDMLIIQYRRWLRYYNMKDAGEVYYLSIY